MNRCVLWCKEFIASVETDKRNLNICVMLRQIGEIKIARVKVAAEWDQTKWKGRRPGVCMLEKPHKQFLIVLICDVHL